jgi:hypothetical protein
MDLTVILVLPAHRPSGALLAGTAFRILILAALLIVLLAFLVLLLLLLLGALTLLALASALTAALLALLLVALLFVRHNLPPICLMAGARTARLLHPIPRQSLLNPAPITRVPSRVRVGFPLSATLLRCCPERILSVTPL